MASVSCKSFATNQLNNERATQHFQSQNTFDTLHRFARTLNIDVEASFVTFIETERIFRKQTCAIYSFYGCK